MTPTTNFSRDFEAIMHQLESEDFYCSVTVASTISYFYRKLWSQMPVQSLYAYILEDPSNVNRVLDYAQRIVVDSFGTERNEKDAALCGCLVALARAASPEVQAFLQGLRDSTNLALKWGSELADYVSSFGTGVTLQRASGESWLFFPHVDGSQVQQRSDASNSRELITAAA